MRLAPRRTVPGVGLARAGDHFEQRGFARAVAAHHGPALAAADGEIETFIDDALAVSLVEILHHRHLVARARRNAEFEFDHLAALRQLDLFDFVERFDAALHLRGFGGVGAEAVDEALLLGEHGLLARESGLLIGLADGALALVEIVIAGVGDDLAGVDFGDLRNDAVHEFAIVRGHQERAGIRLEELLQPDDGFEVEVIGGLVHQQHVGASEQHARQRHAHFPAAGERADIAIDLIVGEAQAVQHFAGLRFERVAAEVLVFFLHLAEAGERAVHIGGLRGVFHGVLQGFEFMMQIAHAAAAGDGFIEDRAALHLFDVLAEVADGQFFGKRDGTFVRLLFAHHHAEERGFAGAVGSDQADLLARVQLEGGFDED